MKRKYRIRKAMFSILAPVACGAFASVELPEPIHWYEFNGNLFPTAGDVILTRWNKDTNKDVTDGSGGTYCKVRCELSSNNAVTGCEPYSSSLGITNCSSTGWTMAFSAMPSAVSNAVLFALGNKDDYCWDGFALKSNGSNTLAFAKWTQNNQHVLHSPGTISVPHLNERLHSIVLTCSALKAGTRWDRDLVLYVDGSAVASFTAAYTPRNEFQMFSVQTGTGNTGLVSGKDGVVDDFRFYGQVLSAEQVALLAAEYPEWPAADVNGIVPEHWLVCDGSLRSIGRTGLTIGGNSPSASDFIVSRESGRKALTGAMTYGGNIKYSGDFTLFCSAKMPSAANGILCHLGYMGTDSQGDSHSLVLVRGTVPGKVKLVTLNRGGKDLRTLVETDVPLAAGKFHSYAVVYSDGEKTVTLFVDGKEKGTGSVLQQPYNASWQFFSLCGGLGKSGLSDGPDGAIEDFRIYSQALDTEEIEALAEEFPYKPYGFLIRLASSRR